MTTPALEEFPPLAKVLPFTLYTARLAETQEQKSAVLIEILDFPVDTENPPEPKELRTLEFLLLTKLGVL